MLLLDCKMPVPEGTRYSRQKHKGNTYLYYRERSYRDETGKKKHILHCVGKIFPDPENEFGNKYECLAPNEKFFLLHGKPVPQSRQTSSQGRPRKAKISPAANERPDSILGYSLACHFILDELGITDLLEKYYGTKIANEIVEASSFFSAGCPGGLSNIDDYTSENIYFTERPITSTRLSELCKEIDEVSNHELFSEWIEKHKDVNDCICYDVTSISSCYKNSIFISYEYNRDGDDLPQENAVIFCRAKDKMPLFYDVYDRSVNDFSNLPNVIEKARNAGLSGALTLVFDGNFKVGSVIDHEYLRKFDLIFSAQLSSRINIRDMMLEWLNSPSYENETFYNDSNIFRFHECDFQIGKTKTRLIFYKSPGMQFEDEQNLGKIYAKNKHELDSREMLSPEATKRLSLFFDINRDEKGYFTYKFNQQKFAEMLKLCGVFVLFTTRRDISAQEILSTYSGKQSVEIVFDIFKSKTLHERIQVLSDDSSRGKLFFTFIGLIIRTEIEKRIRPFLDKEKFGYESAVSRLNGIKYYRDGDKWKLMDMISRERQDLAQLLNLPLCCFARP